MRDVFSQTVPQNGRISVAEGYFDSVAIEDGWADIVVIAQVYALEFNYVFHLILK